MLNCNSWSSDQELRVRKPQGRTARLKNDLRIAARQSWEVLRWKSPGDVGSEDSRPSIRRLLLFAELCTPVRNANEKRPGTFLAPGLRRHAGVASVASAESGYQSELASVNKILCCEPRIAQHIGNWQPVTKSHKVSFGSKAAVIAYRVSRLHCPR